jgi:competence protein ComEC
MEGVIDLSKTVYITSSGDKYHKKGCSYLKSKIKTTLYCAESVGFEPCSRCY